MGLFLTLLYILTAYISPSSMFEALAQYRIEIVIAVFTLIGTLFASEKPAIIKMPQFYVLMGLGVVTFLSIATTGWIGGGRTALLDFSPVIFSFFFIVMNCRTKRQLQILVVTLLSVCFFVIFMGCLALATGDTLSPYLLTMGENANGDAFLRLRGLGFINDPNDFGQLLVSLTPCLFFFWRPKRAFFNTAFVLIPAGILVFGTYLTHSRGAMIALLVVLALSIRRKIGTIPSAILAAALFAVMTAVGWAGNRNVSVEAGADRMDAWSAGLEMIKQHPIFGVGFGAYADHYTITAHNTIVVCAAELGMVGLFVWLLFVCSAYWEVMTAGSSPVVKDTARKEERSSAYGEGPFSWIRSTTGLHTVPATAPLQMKVAMPSARDFSFGAVKLSRAAVTEEELKLAEDEDVRRFARVVLISLTGFLAAGWFLSRAFQMTLFVYCGMVEGIYQLALQRGLVPARLPLRKLAWVSLFTGIGLLGVVYILVRIQHSMGIA
jgi:O-antigen ligase